MDRTSQSSLFTCSRSWRSFVQIAGPEGAGIVAPSDRTAVVIK